MAESPLTSPKPKRTRIQRMSEPTYLSSSSVRLSEELQCCVCLDVFSDPVSTPCGHNFCRMCLKQCWDNSQIYSCPYCKETFSKRPELNINTTLREVTLIFKEKFSLRRSEVLCDVCDERKMKALKSCQVCHISYCETHLDLHQKITLKKHKLLDPVENIKDYICEKHERPLEFFCRDDQTRVCVFCAFGDHKNHNIVPLEEESKEKKIDSSSLFRAPDMKNWSEISMKTHVSVETLRRTLTQLQETLNENITQTELMKMQQYAVDVTLDPDTAHPNLILSEDRKRVSTGDIRHKLPDNPERFDKCVNVLGKEGFTSGKFYFEVQVKDKTEWTLGVARESINRKGFIRDVSFPQNGLWTVGQGNENKYWARADPSVSLCLKVKPQKVGVFVDYEEGLVCFYDVESRSHIYSFTAQTFTEKLFPYLCPGPNYGGENSAPLIISPVHYNK